MDPEGRKDTRVELCEVHLPCRVIRNGAVDGAFVSFWNTGGDVDGRHRPMWLPVGAVARGTVSR